VNTIEKIYLDVQWHRKDYVKGIGGHMEPNTYKWYVLSNSLALEKNKSKFVPFLKRPLGIINNPPVPDRWYAYLNGQMIGIASGDITVGQLLGRLPAHGFLPASPVTPQKRPPAAVAPVTPTLKRPAAVGAAALSTPPSVPNTPATAPATVTPAPATITPSTSIGVEVDTRPSFTSASPSVNANKVTPREPPPTCKFYTSGRCKKGDSCPFTHAGEIKHCIYFARGKCSYGDKCKNAHL
jgi:RNA-binding, Nab2-type zinc finger